MAAIVSDARSQAKQIPACGRWAFLPSDTLRLPAGLGFVLNPLEQVPNPHPQRLGHQVQAGERNVHPAGLESPHLGSVKTRAICKLILRPATIRQPSLARLCSER